jgi:hypothetical protein
MALTMTAPVASAHQLRANGQPSDLNGDRNGYVVWNDGHDLQLRMTASKDSVKYRGTLQTNGRFKLPTREGDRQKEHVTISNKGHTLHFEGNPSNTDDGFKVRVEDSDHVDLHLKRDGNPAPADRIWIGNGDQHPGSSDFTLHV